ncbi:NUAK family SNF1-like kinase 1 isoform X2 [Liolophura sinensis]
MMEANDSMRFTNSQPIIHYHRHNLKNRFELIKTLGEGTYGKVKLAVEVATGEKVAIKYIRKNKIQDDQDLNRIRREIKVMTKLKHPHIINVREVFENKEKIVMVMDYASGGELYDYIKSRRRLNDMDARKIFRQIVSAVHYCHENGVVHRDLKLENIVMDGYGSVRIADFGLSNFYGGNDLLTTYCGSPLYASPEIVNGVPYIGPEVDCWSLGVLLYTLVYGAMPFDGSDFKTLKKQISAADYYVPLCHSEAASLITKILKPNPEERATLEKIDNHWWVNRGYSSTPSGSPYPSAAYLSSTPQFSFLSFLAGGNIGTNDIPYNSKYSVPIADSTDHRFDASFEKGDAACKLSDLNDSVHESSKGARKKHYKSHCDVGGSETGSDTLSNHSSEETKFLFDVDKKPPRGILKKRGKYSGSDSSCGLEESTATSPGHVSPVSSDLSYELADISSVSEEDTRNTSQVPKYRNDQNTLLSESLALQYSTDVQTKDSLDNYQGFDRLGNRAAKESTSSEDNSEDTPRNMSSPCTLSTEDISKVPVRRGILKRPKRSNTDDQKNRNSMGSQGSNSSGDLLDFSYDSTEGENLMSKFCVSTKPASKPSSDTSMDSEEDSISSRTRFHSMSVSEEDLSFKDCVFEDLDLEEARDICRKALEICSIKGV